MVIGLIAKHGIDAMTLVYRAKEGLDAAASSRRMAKSIAMSASLAPSTLAVFNAAVRIMSIPCRQGWELKKYLSSFALQTVAMLILFPAGKTAALLAACGLIGWNYGAMFTLFPATLLQYYGLRRTRVPPMGCFYCLGIAGFLRTLFGGRLQADGSFLVPSSSRQRCWRYQ